MTEADLMSDEDLPGAELVAVGVAVSPWVIHFGAVVCTSSPSMPGSLRLIPDRTRGPR